MTSFLLAYAGLVRPYRFERTLALAAALLLAIVVGGFALLLTLKGDITSGSPRFWHFLYLAGLLALTLLALSKPRIVIVLLCLVTLELGLGLGSAVLYKYRLIVSSGFFPRDFVRPPYGWHPLLQALPLATPPERFGKARVFFNSERLRGRERTPEELRARTVLAVFGGSTTLDFVSPEGQSWPDRLEDLLGPGAYAVLNHGVAGYSTAQNLIQTLFYATKFGVPPRCSLYYVGWNDHRSIHLKNIDPGYADFQAPGLVDAFEARRVGGPGLAVSPTLSMLGRLVVLAVDTVRPAATPPGTMSSAPDPAFEAVYLRNIRAISAVNRQRGIRTIWVGQIMNRAALTGDGTDGWVPYVRNKDLWPAIEHLNGVLRREAAALGDPYIDVPVGDFDMADFSDEGHFVPRGSLKFATSLAPAVARACPPP